MEPVALLPFVPGGKDFERSRALFRELGFEELPKKFSGFQAKPPTEFPWGREVHFVDLAGVCWHVGLP